MAKILVTIEEKLLARLDREARAKGLNRSAYIQWLAARELGWHDTALLGAHEMAVPHGLPRCVRILIHLNTDLPPQAIKHIYLGDAASLRPDRPLPVEAANG